ncbi:unnamed protein product, partial [Mesorhabditis belari]|uniref:Potassium channel domain-containing protein n=1 Tax=Mesorhabditis belari TaxID=2138241 RepID=A0AAF3FFH5_9BILA
MCVQPFLITFSPCYQFISKMDSPKFGFHQHGYEGSKAEVESVVTDLEELLPKFNQIKLDALKLVLEKKKVEFQGSDDVTFEEFKQESSSTLPRRPSMAPVVATVYEESDESTRSQPDRENDKDKEKDREKRDENTFDLIVQDLEPATEVMKRSPHANRFLARHISRQNSQDRNRIDEEQNAIDRYYENNQYSVTGMFQKNEDTMNRIPANYQKILREARERGAEEKSTRSSKSRPALPIPGANENRFLSSFYWLAARHRVIGLRHLLMFLMVVGYTLLGGLIFNATEGGAERRGVAEALEALESKLTQISTQMVIEIDANSTTFTDPEATKQFLRDTYTDLLRAEGRWEQSAYQKNLSDANMLWNFWSACFYSTNLFMTVGYGVIAPFTDLGRVISIIYSIIFIPLSNVVIRDLGQWFLLGLTKVYARLLIRWRAASGGKIDDDEDIALPISIAALTVLIYWMFCSFLTWLYDGLMGSSFDTGMSFWDSIYFSFITLTAIGLGDLMPKNVPRSPLMKIWYFLGLPVFKVVNRVSYVAVENGIFGTFTVFEKRLEQAYMQKKDQVSPSAGDTRSITNMESVSMNENLRRRRQSLMSAKAAVEEQEQINEALNNFTVRSIATFMKARADVYGGDFGRIRVTKAQLEDRPPSTHF